jgi:soluble lytic murein transglycosylase-like protein
LPNRPTFTRPALAALGLAAAALSGCVASGENATLGLAPTDLALSLPETVSVLPEFSGRTDVAFAEPTEAVAGAEQATMVGEADRVARGSDRVAGAEPVFQPVGYAANEMAGAEIGARSTGLDQLIAKYAALYEVPEALVRRVVKRESTFNPKAFNKGHWGLMQIKHATARGMGYNGPAQGLLDAETNLKYAVKYLRGAFLVAGGNFDVADRLYQTGYYYHAKRMGLLDETGLGKDRVRRRVKG